jgi:hypothetical protein
MPCPRNDRGCEQGTQSGDNSNSDCESEDLVHERFFSKTRAMATLDLDDGFPALSDFLRVVPMPAVINPFPPLDFPRPPVNPVAIDYRARFRIAAAFSIVIFAKDKLKIGVGRFFYAVGDTVQ